MCFQETDNRTFILFRRECAGRIDKPSSRTQHGCRLFHNLRLSLCAHTYIFRTPVGECLFLFAKHSLTGTGRINYDPVKKKRKTGSQTMRRLIGHQCVANPHSLQIGGQNSGPLRMNLIGDQNPFPPQAGCQFRALAARCRTEVQHTLPRLCTAEHGRYHGAGLLDIIHSCLMPGETSRSEVPGIIKTVRFPWDLLQLSIRRFYILSGGCFLQHGQSLSPFRLERIKAQ